MDIWDILKFISILLGCAAAILWVVLLFLQRKGNRRKGQVPRWLPVAVFGLFLLYCLLRLLDSLNRYTGARL